MEAQKYVEDSLNVHFGFWLWVPRKSNRNLCHLNFSQCIKCLKNKIYGRQYIYRVAIPRRQRESKRELKRQLQGAQSRSNCHEIYALTNWLATATATAISATTSWQHLAESLKYCIFPSAPSYASFPYISMALLSSLLGNFQLLIFQSVRSLLQRSLLKIFVLPRSWMRMRMRMRMGMSSSLVFVFAKETAIAQLTNTERERKGDRKRMTERKRTGSTCNKDLPQRALTTAWLQAKIRKP